MTTISISRRHKHIFPKCFSRRLSNLVLEAMMTVQNEGLSPSCIPLYFYKFGPISLHLLIWDHYSHNISDFQIFRTEHHRRDIAGFRGGGHGARTPLFARNLLFIACKTQDLRPKIFEFFLVFRGVGVPPPFLERAPLF
jgi:hypothetical protein